MIWLIELSIILVTGMLIFHAQSVYNKSFILVFWISGVVMGFLREIAFVRVGELYAYGDFHFSIQGIPLIAILMWTNFSYIGWQWSNNFLKRDYLEAKPFDYHLPLIFMTMALIAFFFEAFQSQYGLIQWNLDSIVIQWGRTPLLVPFIYGWTGVAFIKSLKYLSQQPAQKWRLLTLKLALVQPIVVLIVIGLSFLSNLVIILLFS